MKGNKVKRIRQKIVMFRRQFLQDDTGVFAQALGDQKVAAVMDKLVEPYRERIYSPVDTLRLFVGQVLSSDRACQDVNRDANGVRHDYWAYWACPALNIVSDPI